MSNILIQLYSLTPKWLRIRLGKTTFLSKIRNSLLRSNHTFKTSCVQVKHNYLDYKLNFKFNASIQIASKARHSGIESKLLLNSISLFGSHASSLTILDIGANFGYLSLVWSQSLCKDGGHVYSFEPNINVFNTFKKSIYQNNLEDIITLENFAVGSSIKPIELIVNNTTSNVMEIETAKERYTVDMITIDHYIKSHQIKQCDLIKIDVDGIELEILKGSLLTLKSFKPIFIVETNNDMEIISFFKTNNYKVLDMNLNCFNETMPIPLNVFCVPNPIL